jgi:hypothetical protein
VARDGARELVRRSGRRARRVCPFRAARRADGTHERVAVDAWQAPRNG